MRHKGAQDTQVTYSLIYRFETGRATRLVGTADEAVLAIREVREAGAGDIEIKDRNGRTVTVENLLLEAARTTR